MDEHLSSSDGAHHGALLLGGGGRPGVRLAGSAGPGARDDVEHWPLAVHRVTISRNNPASFGAFRFVAALGMGGEWSLGV
jgi:hypothetical protein